MQINLNKDITYRLYEAISRGDIPALDHIFSTDYVEHATLFPWISPNCAGVKQYVRVLREAFPDLKFDILDIAADKDKVWARVLMTGTQRGEFNGVPATGRKVQIERIDIYRFGPNRIVEHWSVMEQLALYQQLGEYLGQETADVYEMRF